MITTPPQQQLLITVDWISLGFKITTTPTASPSLSPFQIFTSLHSSFLTALKMAAGGGLGTGGGNPIWSFVWFLGLIFCGWPLAGFCAGWYILILPFAVCFDGFTVSLSFETWILFHFCHNTFFDFRDFVSCCWKESKAPSSVLNTWWREPRSLMLSNKVDLKRSSSVHRIRFKDFSM